MTGLNNPAKKQTLPAIIAGPLLRHCTSEQVTLWLMSSRPMSFQLSIAVTEPKNQTTLFDAQLTAEQHQQVQVGTHAYIHLLVAKPDTRLPEETLLEYDLHIEDLGETKNLKALVSGLCFDGYSKPNFVIASGLNNILHGSCRKPHHHAEDGLLAVEQQIQSGLKDVSLRPDLLIFSGDQVYIDDVAGPMLQAIHQVIKTLGLYDETFEQALIPTSAELYEHPQGYYQREQLLPGVDGDSQLQKLFFRGKKKPLFTSVHAQNHLISLAEMIAMYALVWSPALWPALNFSDKHLAEEDKQAFAKELEHIIQFSKGLTAVRRALAHVPVYMIFDDHDVTDDWNLTRAWEEAVYGHPFSKRIIGNAMIAYWLCQGWGNQPQAFNQLMQSELIQANKIADQNKLIDKLLNFEQWHYQLNTQPPVLVLDTRTRRWRSESDPNRPSGLMDWEALSELQQNLIGKDQVIMVSAAPIFGVKLIEAIQKVFTWLGQPLMVDAENWMAHRGTASVMLNIFRHKKTPQQFFVLSGDVHYSFVYDVKLRFKRQSPRITQITASGIKNTFPDNLLKWFDRLNQILYARYSPLNWFTQRRRMRIRHRKPSGAPTRTLLNKSGIGQLQIEESSQTKINIVSPCSESNTFPANKVQK